MVACSRPRPPWSSSVTPSRLSQNCIYRKGLGVALEEDASVTTTPATHAQNSKHRPPTTGWSQPAG